MNISLPTTVSFHYLLILGEMYSDSNYHCQPSQKKKKILYSFWEDSFLKECLEHCFLQDSLRHILLNDFAILIKYFQEATSIF